MSLEESYNKLYSEKENVFGNGEAENFVQDITKYKNSGTVLELGAGQGRNSLFLANNGFEVTAQDISFSGIEKITTIAQENGLDIHAEVKDIRDINLEKNYDVFVCTYVLHHLSREEAISLIKQIQNHTNNDGINAITSFTKKGDFYNNDSATENFYLDTNELKELYFDWEILEYSEIETKANARDSDGNPMVNTTAKILARKTK